MLVLTRRPGESLVVQLADGEQIEITVLSLKSNQVRIGTKAPEHIPILRAELLENGIARK